MGVTVGVGVGVTVGVTVTVGVGLSVGVGVGIALVNKMHSASPFGPIPTATYPLGHGIGAQHSSSEQ